MPYYTYLDKETKEVQPDLGLQSISEMEAYLEENPHLELGISGTPGFADAFRLGLVKPSQTFRDELRRIKHHHPLSTVNIR